MSKKQDLQIIHIKIDKKLNSRFREKVFNRMGFHRGAIQEAVIEAIKEWCDKED